jgi:ATP-dependent Clp protease ATP-binding subunit ClpB
MDDKLTHKSQDALSTAVRRAAADGSPQVEPLHLLLALLEQADGTPRRRRRPGAGRQAG